MLFVRLGYGLTWLVVAANTLSLMVDLGRGLSAPQLGASAASAAAFMIAAYVSARCLEAIVRPPSRVIVEKMPPGA